MGREFTVERSKLKVWGAEEKRFNTESTEIEHIGHGDFVASRGGLVEGGAEF
jgi:hypothetical protein